MELKLLNQKKVLKLLFLTSYFKDNNGYLFLNLQKIDTKQKKRFIISSNKEVV